MMSLDLVPFTSTAMNEYHHVVSLIMASAASLLSSRKVESSTNATHGMDIGINCWCCLWVFVGL